MRKKIKLFVDAHCFDTEYQGTQTFVKELYTELSKQQDDLDIYFGSRYPDRISQALPFIEPSKILPYQKHKLPYFRLFFDIPAILSKHAFHFAHFQNIAPVFNGRSRHIVTLHDVLFNDYKQDFPKSYRYSRNWLFKRSFKQAQIKTTVSQYSLKRICYHYKISPHQISIISNAVNKPATTIFSSKSAAQNYISTKYGIQNFILCVSRIEPRKNQLLLLDTYLQLGLQNQNIALVFIGKESIPTPKFRKKLQEQLESSESQVYWLEQVNYLELQAFYNASLLFVYPSKAEGFGIPPLEAALCNVPVLCSSTTAMESFSFFNPYTFCPDNVLEFKEKLHRMLKEPLTHQTLVSIQKKILDQYSWAQSAQKFYQLIKQSYVQ
ncbi:glycosyltransferase family 4 protein [Chitinophagaceae bacterium LB-8]|uniref:Glycosyltransferase family 4 protein n=1 Tax=Paraflavisolibacter caeni TaxID=2982496 RepID=A0A9X2XNK4_9BACT|nr:glycosyltransferase family 1 protein [Paraflavisolibacter caeni]MCU7548983.1 glycosyltransferase family 4 protein [Paraflavisolibacter caeni]